jgi:hypothetical protein
MLISELVVRMSSLAVAVESSVIHFDDVLVGSDWLTKFLFLNLDRGNALEESDVSTVVDFF